MTAKINHVQSEVRDFCSMPKLLEVIVTSVEEAVEAEHGAADRLELVCSLETGGLTPALDVVAGVLQAVSIPVRVMLRENASMSLSGDAELLTLKSCASKLAEFPMDGFVLGFIQDGAIDLATMQEILGAARGRPATFHRAFDELSDPLGAIQQLKRLPQIDRILTTGGDGSNEQRLARLLAFQKAASPEIKILSGAGICPAFLHLLEEQPDLGEIHVGRAARSPQTISGRVNRHQIAALKSR